MFYGLYLLVSLFGLGAVLFKDFPVTPVILVSSIIYFYRCSIEAIYIIAGKRAACVNSVRTLTVL